jgi:hypothetical protein
MWQRVWPEKELGVCLEQLNSGVSTVMQLAGYSKL